MNGLSGRLTVQALLGVALLISVPGSAHAMTQTCTVERAGTRLAPGDGNVRQIRVWLKCKSSKGIRKLTGNPVNESELLVITLTAMMTGREVKARFTRGALQELMML